MLGPCEPENQLRDDQHSEGADQASIPPHRAMPDEGHPWHHRRGHERQEVHQHIVLHFGQIIEDNELESCRGEDDGQHTPWRLANPGQRRPW